MTKSRNLLTKRKPWTEVELALLKANYADTLTDDLATVLGRSKGTVHQKANSLGLFKTIEFTSITATLRQREMVERGSHKGFPKGHVPADKGLRRPGWCAGDMAKTQFKKGQMPHTWMPVGSHCINGDGWLEYKFSDEPGPYTKRWVPVHRKVWIEANGPIPPKHIVVFRPGRRTTDVALITLDAIELITLADNMRRNTVHNLPKELVGLVQLRAALNRQINKRSRSA